MGNEISWPSFQCGLCYFELKGEAPSLDEPAESRRHMPNGSWSNGLFDNPPRPPESCRFVQLRTRPLSLRDSVDRGCIGCAAIWQAIGDELREKGFVLDEKCMQEPCLLYWLVGSRASHHPSLQVELLVDRGGKIYHIESLKMTLGYTGRATREF